MPKKRRKNWNHVPVKKTYKRCKLCSGYDCCRDWNELLPDWDECENFEQDKMELGKVKEIYITPLKNN